MCGLPPANIVDSSPVCPSRVRRGRGFKKLPVPANRVIISKSIFKAMSLILRFCERGYSGQTGLGPAWAIFLAEDKDGECYLDTPDGLGFLGWLEMVHSHSACINLQFAEYLERALDGRREKIQQDTTTQLRRRLFDLCEKVKTTCLDDPIGHTYPYEGQSRWTRTLKLEREALAKADSKLTLKKDIVKAAILIAELREPHTHDDLWGAWFDKQKEHEILTIVESQLFKAGFTEDFLQLEIASDRSKNASTL